jgi:hypothetical protein
MSQRGLYAQGADKLTRAYWWSADLVQSSISLKVDLGDANVKARVKLTVIVARF